MSDPIMHKQHYNNLLQQHDTKMLQLRVKILYSVLSCVMASSTSMLSTSF